MNDSILQTASKYFNLPVEEISLYELEEDWLSCLKEDSSKTGKPSKVGGLRLIIPKNLKFEPFFIASSQGATSEYGVSGEYKIRLDIETSERKKAAEIISKYIDLSVVNIYKLIVKKELRSNIFNVNNPKELLNELLQNFTKIEVSLERPENHGGYNID